MIRKFMLAAAAAGLVSAPVAALAPPERVSAQTDGEQDELVGLLWQYLILPAILAVVLGVLLQGDDDVPTSP